MLLCFWVLCKSIFDPCGDLIPDLPVTLKALLFRTRHEMGIGKCTVDGFFCTGHAWAGCMGLIAERDGAIKGFTGELSEGF